LLSTDGTRAVFEKSLPLEERDNELLAIGKQLRKPLVVSTRMFGDLVLNRKLNWFEGEANWNGGPIDLQFKTDSSGSIDTALKTAEALWSNQSRWKREVDGFAVKELLAIKNDAWLGEDELPLTADEFIGRMELMSISFSGDGSFEFWHDDGDLFWGHSIQVCGNLKDGLTNADIPG
jgi:hypothetical protein